MLGSIFFIVTTLFSLLFLVLSVSLKSWPCGGVFENSCQVHPYPLRPVGALISISVIFYLASACIDLCHMHLQTLDDGIRRVLAYAALGISGISSLFVVSAMLAYFNALSHSWSVMLSLVGMTLGCSLTFQLGMRIFLDSQAKGTETQ